MVSDPLAISQAGLNAARDRVRRAMMGRALNTPAATLDALAEVSDADMAVAESRWRAANPGPLSSLLDARPDERDG